MNINVSLKISDFVLKLYNIYDNYSIWIILHPYFKNNYSKN